MANAWGPEGPAFEIPQIYRSESKALLARAALLALLALLVLILALADPGFPRWMATRRLRLPPDGTLIHLLFGLLLLMLAVMDVVRAARQRVLRLLPGQPAPLVPVVRAANLANPHAAPLAALLEGGVAAPAPAPADWPRLLQRLAPQAGALPLGLQLWLAQRVSYLLLTAGVLLTLALAWLLLPPVGVALAAAPAVAMAGFVLWRGTRPERRPPSPRRVGVLLALNLLLGFGAGAAQASALATLGQWLHALGLPLATALLLAILLLAELLALRAGLVEVDTPLAHGPAAQARSVEIHAEPESVQQELERELHRYWHEGVPNRRYLWQTNQADYKNSGAGFATSSLEEAQPVMRAATAGHAGQRSPWLLALLALALLLTLAGGLLWGAVVWAQLQRAAEPYVLTATAALLVVVGGYVLRLAHLLWSRVEAESLLLLLHCASTPGKPALRLQWSVLRVRSVFYAAAEHHPGSRTLLALDSDGAAAQRSVDQVQHYAEKRNAASADAAEPGTPVAPTRAARAPAPAPRPSAPPEARLRYCVDCGEAMPSAARFCPRCGERQRSV